MDFDVHRFSTQYDDQKRLILGGVVLPDALSLEAHSDGDVVLHAVCDALLGAAALGDIGQHFPDSDAAFAGADSAELLGRVMAAVAEKGLSPSNVDITVVAQQPKLAPHRAAMQKRMSELLNLPVDRVNVKATTTEKLGTIGRGEGIACHCVALIG